MGANLTAADTIDGGANNTATGSTSIGKDTLNLLSGYTAGNENWHRLRVVKKDGTEFLGTPVKPIQK